MRSKKRTLTISCIFLGLIVLLFVLARVFHSQDDVLKTEWNKLDESPQKNYVKIPFYDPDRGGEPFLFEAEIADAENRQDLDVINMDSFNYTFGKGTVTLPLDTMKTGRGEESKGSEILTLDFQKAECEKIPGLTEKVEVKFTAPGSGVLKQSGINMEFQSLDITWESPGYADIRSSERVVLERKNPFFLLEGDGGCDGLFKESGSLARFTFFSPVSVFLSRESGSSILALTGEDNAPGALEYFCVTCKGALVLDLNNHNLVFDKDVLVFPTEKVGKEAKENKTNNFRCHQLEIKLDPETRQPLYAEAKRGTALPVQGVWDTVTVESGKVRWTTQDETVTLSDAPMISGKTEQVRFFAQSKEITMDMGSHVAVLSGRINSTIEQQSDNPEERFPALWGLTADLGKVFLSKEDRLRIEKVVALTDPMIENPTGIVLRSREKGGITALGGRLVYDVVQEELVVTGLPNQAPSLHFEHEGEKVKAEARRVRFSFAEKTIFLEEGVSVAVKGATPEGRAYTHRVAAHGASITLADDAPAEDAAPGTEAVGRGGAEADGSAGFSKQNLATIRAWAKNKDEPVVFHFDGRQRFRLVGGLLEWKRGDNRIRLSPYKELTRQVIELNQGTLFCKQFEFDPDAALLEAEGNVALNNFTVDGRTFSLEADTAECRFNTTDIKEMGPPTLSKLKSVKASSLPLKKVVFTGEQLEAVAEFIIYDGDKERLLFSGKGMQRFRFRGENGTDELAAQKVWFSPKENRLELTGGLSGHLYQENWSKKGLEGVSDLPKGTKWQYEAQTAEAQFQKTGNEWKLITFEAEKDVKLSNADLQLFVSGEHLTYDHRNQALTLDAKAQEGGTGLQSITYGPLEQKNWLVARTIRISRRERIQRGALIAEIVAVLTEDVRCNFHLRALKDKKEMPKTAPQKLDITADRICFIAPAKKSTTGGSVSFAQAEGNVMFKAYSRTDSNSKPLYSGSGARALYCHTPMHFALFGEKNDKAVIEHPLGEERGTVITISRRSDGSFRLESGVECSDMLKEPFAVPVPGETFSAASVE